MFLNMPAAERRSYVYRVTSLDRLFELFVKRQNVLVSPELWDDPFENFILKSQRISRHGWYGQCWTRKRASDAMWRLYSQDSKGVRIRSTPELLIDGLSKSSTAGKGFIGTVRYLGKNRLITFARRALQAGNLHRAQSAANTLLVKRPAFSHESEIRLLFCQHPSGKKLFEYPVDPHALVDQLMLDPRLSHREAEDTKAEIRRRTGFGGSIKRSLLYGPPPILMDGGQGFEIPGRQRGR